MGGIEILDAGFQGTEKRFEKRFFHSVPPCNGFVCHSIPNYKGAPCGLKEAILQGAPHNMAALSSAFVTFFTFGGQKKISGYRAEDPKKQICNC